MVHTGDAVFRHEWTVAEVLLALSLRFSVRTLTNSAKYGLGTAHSPGTPRGAPRVYSSSMRQTEDRATPVMGPLVSGERITSRNGPRYSSGSTSDQSAPLLQNTYYVFT